MRVFLCGGMLALLVCVGCLPSSSPIRREEKLPELPFREKPKAVPTVSPEGIDEKNAWQRAKALRAEIEADSLP